MCVNILDSGINCIRHYLTDYQYILTNIIFEYLRISICQICIFNSARRLYVCVNELIVYLLKCHPDELASLHRLMRHIIYILYTSTLNIQRYSHNMSTCN